MSTPALPPCRSDIASATAPAKPSALAAVRDAIQNIDRMVQPAEATSEKEHGDSHVLANTMDTEQIEGMLVKWTHIAHYLVNAYQQAQGLDDAKSIRSP